MSTMMAFYLALRELLRLDRSSFKSRLAAAQIRLLRIKELRWGSSARVKAVVNNLAVSTPMVSSFDCLTVCLIPRSNAAREPAGIHSLRFRNQYTPVSTRRKTQQLRSLRVCTIRRSSTGNHCVPTRGCVSSSSHKYRIEILAPDSRALRRLRPPTRRQAMESSSATRARVSPARHLSHLSQGPHIQVHGCLSSALEAAGEDGRTGSAL